MTSTHGQGKINLELLLRLARRGYSVEVVASWLEAAAQEEQRIRWQRIAVSKRVPTNWLRCELFRHRAQQHVAGRSPVTINNGAAAVVPSILNIAMFVHSAWLESRWHPRHARSLHGRYLTAFNQHQSRLEKQAFAQAEWVVALSDIVRSELIEFCDLPEDRVITITPGVDARMFHPIGEGNSNPLRQACGLAHADDRLLLLFVGEIRSSRKNLDLVIDAVRNRPDVLLAVVGDKTGSLYPAAAAKLGIADRTYFLGQRGDVPELMRGADAFVFPTHYEPFGLVITEAMACGLPVVTTRQAGAACVVEHQKQGWLLDDGGDISGMVAAIDELSDPAIRSRWGAAAREKAETLTWDRMADQYERLIDFSGACE